MWHSWSEIYLVDEFYLVLTEILIIGFVWDMVLDIVYWVWMRVKHNQWLSWRLSGPLVIPFMHLLLPLIGNIRVNL